MGINEKCNPWGRENEKSFFIIILLVVAFIILFWSFVIFSAWYFFHGK